MTNLSFTNTEPSATTERSSMIDEILNAHNQYRAKVGVPPLILFDNLANHTSTHQCPIQQISCSMEVNHNDALLVQNMIIQTCNL